MIAELFAQATEALQFSFIQRALLAGSLIAVSCALLGVFLVLRRFSMIGDGLGHVSFGAIGLSLMLGLHPVYASIPVVLLGSLWIMRLAGRSGVQGDAAIGLTSAMGVATGMMLAGIGGGFNVDLFSYLFGNILVISATEVWLSLVLTVVVLLAVVLFYHDLFVIAFEEESAQVLGVAAERVNTLLVLCTALTVVLSIRIVGILLVSSLIIMPGVAALRVASGFRSTLLLAVVFSLFSVWIGILVSYLLDLPTGATIVFVNFFFFLGALLVGRLGARG